MRDFFHYFFGAGDEIEFKYFSLAHILPIILAVIIIYLIFRYRDRLRTSKWDDKIRLILFSFIKIVKSRTGLKVFVHRFIKLIISNNFAIYICIINTA